jgi:hypothetical protein
VYAGKVEVKREVAIHEVLHPQVSYSYAEYCASRGIDPDAKPTDRRWLNAKCDVQAMWSHISARNDAFVTEDGRFLTLDRRSRLITLGAGDIVTPDAAVLKFLRVNESSPP